MSKPTKKISAHFICVKSGILAASGTGKTEGHAILAATNEYSSAIGKRQSWGEIFSTKSQPSDARVFEVFMADGNFVAGDEATITACGDRWGMVRLQDYVEPVEADEEEDEDDLEEAA